MFRSITFHSVSIQEIVPANVKWTYFLEMSSLGVTLTFNNLTRNGTREINDRNEIPLNTRADTPLEARLYQSDTKQLLHSTNFKFEYILYRFNTITYPLPDLGLSITLNYDLQMPTQNCRYDTLALSSQIKASNPSQFLSALHERLLELSKRYIEQEELKRQTNSTDVEAAFSVFSSVDPTHVLPITGLMLPDGTLNPLVQGPIRSNIHNSNGLGQPLNHVQIIQPFKNRDWLKGFEQADVEDDGWLVTDDRIDDVSESDSDDGGAPTKLAKETEQPQTESEEQSQDPNALPIRRGYPIPDKVLDAEFFSSHLKDFGAIDGLRSIGLRVWTMSGVRPFEVFMSDADETRFFGTTSMKWWTRMFGNKDTYIVRKASLLMYRKDPADRMDDQILVGLEERKLLLEKEKRGWCRWFWAQSSDGHQILVERPERCGKEGKRRKKDTETFTGMIDMSTGSSFTQPEQQDTPESTMVELDDIADISMRTDVHRWIGQSVPKQAETAVTSAGNTLASQIKSAAQTDWQGSESYSFEQLFSMDVQPLKYELTQREAQTVISGLASGPAASHTDFKLGYHQSGREVSTASMTSSTIMQVMQAPAAVEKLLLLPCGLPTMFAVQGAGVSEVSPDATQIGWGANYVIVTTQPVRVYLVLCWRNIDELRYCLSLGKEIDKTIPESQYSSPSFAGDTFRTASEVALYLLNEIILKTLAVQRSPHVINSNAVVLLTDPTVVMDPDVAYVWNLLGASTIPRSLPELSGFSTVAEPTPASAPQAQPQAPGEAPAPAPASTSTDQPQQPAQTTSAEAKLTPLPSLVYGGFGHFRLVRATVNAQGQVTYTPVPPIRLSAFASPNDSDHPSSLSFNSLASIVPDDGAVILAMKARVYIIYGKKTKTATKKHVEGRANRIRLRRFNLFPNACVMVRQETRMVTSRYQQPVDKTLEEAEWSDQDWYDADESESSDSESGDNEDEDGGRLTFEKKKQRDRQKRAALYRDQNACNPPLIIDLNKCQAASKKKKLIEGRERVRVQVVESVRNEWSSSLGLPVENLSQREALYDGGSIEYDSILFRTLFADFRAKGLYDDNCPSMKNTSMQLGSQNLATAF
ncbi:hypothetical protein BLNAU_676 [Blattamonas nauphoetae]|uniref:Uncharacterized protein n=1 Tax=Blattamonas nauphoetae TaxID=2049346 RepID=A0ABQ9YKF6_9EUKA|nr:hypothetical protein BLNAU_676 [Blattamonas nauphoetae]